MSITFMSLETGDATVSFSSGILTASDGKGTNILEFKSPATYTFAEIIEEEEEEKKEEEKKEKSKEDDDEEVSEGVLPPPPKIKSITHPEEDT